MCKLFNFSKDVAVIGGMASARLRHLSPCSCYFFDNIYYYPDGKTWANILWDVLSGMPSYVADRWDCEDYSLLTKTRIGERYKINGIGVAIGDSPLGYHAWNVLLMDENTLKYLEPQTGDVFDIGDKKYTAEMILW